jgi:hypothetical protein
MSGGASRIAPGKWHQIISALTISTGIQFFILPVLGAGGARSQL